jgi:hypothetical protein
MSRIRTLVSSTTSMTVLVSREGRPVSKAVRTAATPGRSGTTHLGVDSMVERVQTRSDNSAREPRPHRINANHARPSSWKRVQDLSWDAEDKKPPEREGPIGLKVEPRREWPSSREVRVPVSSSIEGAYHARGGCRATETVRSSVSPLTPQGVIKSYPARGPMQQYRLATAETFHCFRCGRSKTSKLVTVYGGKWERLLCNGCYGRLLSIYDIKAGSSADEDRAEAMSRLLLGEAAEDDARQAAQRLVASHARRETLSPLTLRFLGTSDLVADRIAGSPGLDWSVAVLGLCKAFELEMVTRVLDPLASSLSTQDLEGDLADPELASIARYCSGRTPRPPELGTMARFLRTAVSSKDRILTSHLLQGMRRLASRQSDGAWLVAPSGLATVSQAITMRFRNPAVHITELSEDDYHECRAMVIGANGAIWSLLMATDRIRHHAPSA